MKQQNQTSLVIMLLPLLHPATGSGALVVATAPAISTSLLLVLNFIHQFQLHRTSTGRAYSVGVSTVSVFTAIRAPVIRLRSPYRHALKEPIDGTVAGLVIPRIIPSK